MVRREMSRGRRVRLAAVVIAASALLVPATSGAQAITATEGAPFSGTVDSHHLNCPVTDASATIAWGDGVSTAATVTVDGNGNITAGGAHTYARFGQYTGSVAISAKCNGVPITATDPLTATVADAALSASGSSVTAVAGQPFTATVAHFTDANPGGRAADDNATIDWGDGTTTAGTVAAAPAGFAVDGSHTYAGPGARTATIVISDGGTSTATAQTAITVNAAPIIAPPIIVPPIVIPHAQASWRVVSGAPGRVVLDASASAPAGTTVAHYAWNLTSGRQPDVVCPGTEPQLTVISPVARTFAATLAATDGAGVVTLAQQPVTVAAPTGGHTLRRGVHTPVIPVVGVCTGAPPARPSPPLVVGRLAASARRPLGVGGAPPADCSTDVVFGAVDVHGCLNEIDDLHTLPGGLTLGLSKLLCGAGRTEFCVPILAPSRQAGAGRARAAASFTPAVARVIARLSVPSYYTWDAARVDGVDIQPLGGEPLLIIPSASLLITPRAQVFLHGTALGAAGALSVYVPAKGGSIGDLVPRRALKLSANVALAGSVNVALRRAGTTVGDRRCVEACAVLETSFAVPGTGLTDDSGAALNLDATVLADDDAGLEPDTLEMTGSDGRLGGIAIRGIGLRYTPATDTLAGAATLDLGPLGQHVTPVTITHGTFTAAATAISFDGPPIRLAPPPLNIGLTSLHASLLTTVPYPLPPGAYVIGTAAASGGPDILGCPLFSISGSLVAELKPRLSVGVSNANASLLCDDSASGAHLSFDDQGHMDVGAAVNVPVGGIVEVDGDADVAIDIAGGHIQFDGTMHACLNLLIGTPCVGSAEVVISDRGIGACAQLGVGPFSVYAGAGIQFPAHVIPFLDSCDIDDFRSIEPGHARAARAFPTGFTVPHGKKVALVTYTGATAAPRVTLHGPGGRTISAPAGGLLRDTDEVVLSDDAQAHTTYFFINHPAAGTWTATLEPGSAAITSVGEANVLPPPAIHARVTALAHGRRLLAYTITPTAGQAVTFEERAPSGAFKAIGRATARRGSLDFTPSTTLGSTRTIVAQVTQNGNPRTALTVAHYRVAAPAALPAPSRVRLRRHGTTVHVAWHAVPGVVRYGIDAKVSGGRGVYATTSANVRAFTLTGIPSTLELTVRVAAVGPGHRRGHQAHASIGSGPAPAPVVVRPATR